MLRSNVMRTVEKIYIYINVLYTVQRYHIEN